MRLEGCGVCASKHLCAGERPFRRDGGEAEVESAIWTAENGKRRNSREEKSKEKKVETLLPTSTLLKLCAGPRDADRTLLLIHSPSSTSSPIFRSQSLFALVVPPDLSLIILKDDLVFIVCYDLLLGLLLIGIYRPVVFISY